MITLDEIRRQASDLEIDVEIDPDNYLNMHKRGAEGWRFGSLQEYDDPHVLAGAQEWLNNYRTFVNQADQARE